MTVPGPGEKWLWVFLCHSVGATLWTEWGMCWVTLGFPGSKTLGTGFSGFHSPCFLVAQVRLVLGCSSLPLFSMEWGWVALGHSVCALLSPRVRCMLGFSGWLWQDCPRGQVRVGVG